jgi:hypothetical protein
MPELVKSKPNCANPDEPKKNVIVVEHPVPQHSRIDEFTQSERIAPPHAGEVQFKNVLPMISIKIDL